MTNWYSLSFYTHVSLKQKQDSFDAINVTGQPTKNKKTLTTEKTSIIIILLTITNTCRVLALYTAGFSVPFFTVFQLTVPYITGAYRIPSRHQRDTTLCRQAVQDSLAQCRLLASITHLYQLIIEIYPWSSFCCTPLNELILLTSTGRQFRRGVVACRPFASLADRDDSPFHAQFANNYTTCFARVRADNVDNIRLSPQELEVS